MTETGRGMRIEVTKGRRWRLGTGRECDPLRRPITARTEANLHRWCRSKGVRRIGGRTYTPSHTSTYIQQPAKSFHINRFPHHKPAPTYRQKGRVGVGERPRGNLPVSGPRRCSSVTPAGSRSLPWNCPSGKGEQALAAPARAGCHALPVSEGTLTEGGARRGGGRRRRPHEEARRDHRRHPVRQHRRGAPPRGEGRSPRLRQFPSPAARAAPGPQPQDGDRVDVPSKHVAYFTSGKELKELINRDPALPAPPPLSE